MITKDVIEKIKITRPLIHCITNPISINQCANVILALGGNPIMAEHPEEADEITGRAMALLLNLGNITDVRMKSMIISAQRAKEKKIPVVLDLVGVSCSELRKIFADKIIKNYTPDLLKGNYSEIYAMYDKAYHSVGVDNDVMLREEETGGIAALTAKKYGGMVLASGKTDVISDGENIIYVKNGTKRLGKITGTGCMLGAISAACLAVRRDIYSVQTACEILSISGEMADSVSGNGSFEVKLMDNISEITADKIIKMGDVEVEKV